MPVHEPDVGPGDLAQLQRTHHDAVMHIARHYARGRDEAREMYQNAWLQILSSIQSYSGRGTMEHWVRATTRRSCLKFRRDADRASRHYRPTARPADIAADAEPRSLSDEMLDARALTIDAVYDAVVALPERQRTLFLMRTYVGLSVRELAERFGVAEGTVKATLAAAREGIRARLRAADRTSVAP